MEFMFGILQLLLLGKIINGCMDNCVCTEEILSCAGSKIPDQIPENISKVYLEQFNLDNLFSGAFKNNSWVNVTILDVVVESGRTLKNNAFSGLVNLEYLGLHGQNQLLKVESQAFFGLDHVLTLDLSDSFNLYIKNFIPSLTSVDKIILPLLKNLTLAKVQTFTTVPVMMNEDFFQSVSKGRKVKYLDISYFNIGQLDMNYLYLICDSIEYFKAQKVTIIYPKDLRQKKCSSLKTLDLSGLNIPRTLRPISFSNINFNCGEMSLYYDIETFYLNNIWIKSVNPDIVMRNYSLNMTDCQFHTKKVSFSGNTFKWLNVSVVLDPITAAFLEDLDLSDNLLEYISPHALFPSKNIKVLNMSCNQLSIMQEQYPNDLEEAFRALSKLQLLYLANNGFTALPRNTFRNNSRLAYLDLSHNRLTNISFKFEHLTNLKFLDLSNNLIETISDSTRRHFEALHNLPHLQSNRTLNMSEYKELKINLSDNDFQCRCGGEYLKLLDWLKSSPVVYKHKKSYACYLEGKKVNILQTAYAETEEHCHALQVHRILVVAMPTTLAVILVTIVTILIILQRHIKKKNFKNILLQIKNNEFPHKYLVFLSYCSEDGDLVIDKLYPQLRKELRDMTASAKDLVCIGDIHFRPGFAIHNEAMRCIENSAIVVLVVSNEFCQKNWCKMEVGEAYAQRKPIIMLLKGRVDVDLMSPFLSKIFNRYTHASWVNDENEGHMEPDWTRLCASMIELASEDQRENKKYKINAVN